MLEAGIKARNFIRANSGKLLELAAIMKHESDPKTVMAEGGSKITLKLLVDASNNVVLFGEAGKDFVDFIFSLLTLPLASVIKLVNPQNMVGTIGKLYQSVEKLNETYLVANKTTLLQPSVSSVDGAKLLLLGRAKATELKYFYCNNCCKKVTTGKNINCPTCNRVMSISLEFVVPSISSSSSGDGNGVESGGGFVKGVITYMITDDLEVTPMSAISSITLINRFSVKKDVQLEERMVTVGMKEGLALLYASLDSCTVLTDVFLSSSAKKPKASFG